MLNSLASSARCVLCRTSVAPAILFACLSSPSNFAFHWCMSLSPPTTLSLTPSTWLYMAHALDLLRETVAQQSDLVALRHQIHHLRHHHLQKSHSHWCVAHIFDEVLQDEVHVVVGRNCGVAPAKHQLGEVGAVLGLQAVAAHGTDPAVCLRLQVVFVRVSASWRVAARTGDYRRCARDNRGGWASALRGRTRGALRDAMNLDCAKRTWPRGEAPLLTSVLTAPTTPKAPTSKKSVPPHRAMHSAPSLVRLSADNGMLRTIRPLAAGENCYNLHSATRLR